MASSQSSRPPSFRVPQEIVIDLTGDSDPEELPDLTVSVTPAGVQNTTPTASLSSVRTVGSPTRRRRRTVRGLCRRVSPEREAGLSSSAGITNTESSLPSLFGLGRPLFSHCGRDSLSSPATDHTMGSPQKARTGQKRRHCPRSSSPDGTSANSSCLSSMSDSSKRTGQGSPVCSSGKPAHRRLHHKKRRCSGAEQKDASSPQTTEQLPMVVPSVPAETHRGVAEATEGPTPTNEARDEACGSINGQLKLTQKEVTELVLAMKSELLAIAQGRVFSHRHLTFLQGGRARRSLDHTTNIGHFASGTEDMVMDVLMSFFKDIQIKNLDYLLRVLLPEALIRIHRQVTGKVLL